MYSGYEYDASILDPSCGIEILANEIYKPLYKMYINSNEPTMAILGLIKKTLMIQIYNLQARKRIMHTRIHDMKFSAQVRKTIKQYYFY